MPKPLKRTNKTRTGIVSEIQLVQSAERRRALIKDVIFPHLIEINESIGYSKVYLQALSGLINGEFDETRKTTTVGQLKGRLVRKLDEIFKVKDPEQKREHGRYLSLIEKMEDISVQDFSYAAELPRYIDGFITKNKDKSPISEVDIIDILGK